MERQVMDALKGHFRPEFLNRIDDVIIFHRLTREHIRAIVQIQSAHIQALLQDRGIGIELSDGALDLLAEEGYDPVYGARPLRRAIQKRIQDVLAMDIISGKFVEGDTVVVEKDGEKLVFHKKG
jgi:ATP-dependent Clp protease ATP-binding subunit ClpB